MAINDYSRQYWDEFTVFVENFDSLARIEANNGTIIGNFSICEGRFGNGGCFDGGSGYIDYGEGPDKSFDITGAMTVEVWAKINSSANWEGIMWKGSSKSAHKFAIFKSSTDTATAYLSNASGSLTSTTNIADSWHHIAFVFDGINTMYLYVDGTQKDSDTLSSLYSDDNPVRIGHAWGNAYASGSIDEVRISNIARRPVSALWTLNYTLASTEAMRSGSRYYWKVRALDSGGEQG